MKEWGEIRVTNALQVIGRGLVLVTEVDADPGDLVVWKGDTWRVKGVETRRNGMGDGGRVKTGLIVVEPRVVGSEGEAGSSSPLDAIGATGSHGKR